MIYYILRIIVTIILLALFLFAYFKTLYRNISIRHKRIIAGILMFVFILLMIFLWSIKISRIIVRFDSYEEAFKYEYPNAKIIKTFNNENYVFVFFKISGDYSMTSYIKDESGWSLNNFIKHDHNVLKNYDGYIVFEKSINQYDVSIICVTYPEIIAIEADIKDSINSSYESIKLLDEGAWNTTLECAQVNSKLNKNYYLQINDDKYYIFRFFQ